MRVHQSCKGLWSGVVFHDWLLGQSSYKHHSKPHTNHPGFGLGPVQLKLRNQSFYHLRLLEVSFL